MPRVIGERVSCDCKLGYIHFVGLSTRRHHRRIYGVLEVPVQQFSRHVDNYIPTSNSTNDTMIDDERMMDDFMNRNNGIPGEDNEDDEDEVWIYHSSDNDDDSDENDIDGIEEHENENPFEHVIMEDIGSGIDGLVFDTQDEDREILLLKTISGHSDNIFSLICRIRTRVSYEENYEVLWLEMRRKSKRYEI